jgi:transcription elongation factor GreA
MEKEYLTQEKFNALQAELHELKTVKRKEIAEHLEYARSLGDLSENAEYHEAREDQAQTESRIQQIETILKNAVIVTHNHKGDTIEVGSQVTVVKAGESTQTIFTLVGSEEADISVGKISHNSPLGAALFGKKKGETFEFQSPKGIVKYTIVDVK